MLRRWVPVGLVLSSVVAVSSTVSAQTAPTKTAAPTTTAKPAAPTTTAKPATTSKPTDAKTGTTASKPTDAKAAKPTDAKAPATTDAKATTASATAAAPAPTNDPKAASAAATPPATDADKELARLLDDAKKSFKAGQYEKARELYAAAYKQKADHATLLLLAQAEAKANKNIEAAEHLETYLRDAKSASADDRAAADKLFWDVTAKIATWHVKVSVDGADVYLDGKPVGKSPLAGSLFIDVGTHEVEARKEGFLPEKFLIVASPNTETDTMLGMKPAPVEVKPKEDDKKDKPIVAPPPPPSPKWRTYGIIGGGALTALGLGLGVGLTVSAGTKGDEADAQLAELKRTTPNTFGVCGANQFPLNQAGCTKLNDTLSSQDARANGAVAGFVIAGVGAVGTVGLIMLPKFSFGRKLMAMKLTPVIGLDRMGGTLTGTF